MINDEKPTTNPSYGSTRHDEGADSMAERDQDTRARLEQSYRELEHQYDQTREQLQEFNERAVTFIRQNPGWCILGAVAAGYVVGRLASRRWLS